MTLGATCGVGYAAATTVLPPGPVAGAIYGVSVPLGFVGFSRRIRSLVGVENRPLRDAFRLTETAKQLSVSAAQGAVTGGPSSDCGTEERILDRGPRNENSQPTLGGSQPKGGVATA